MFDLSLLWCFRNKERFFISMKYSQSVNSLYFDISNQICEELDRRGFTTEDPEGPKELNQWIYNLIKTNIQGNLNVVEELD